MVQIISILVSVSLSVVLILWLNRCKQRTTGAFVNHRLAKLLVAGALSGFVGAIISILLGLAKLLMRLGPETLSTLSQLSDPDVAQEFLDKLQATSSNFTFVGTFLSTLLLVGLVEEGCRFVALQIATGKKRDVATVLDMVISGALTGIGFQIVEDISYGSGDIVTALLRTFTPFHYLFGAIMGYFIARALLTGKKLNYLWAICIPALLHTLFDSLINSMAHEDIFVIGVLIVTVILIALVIASVVLIQRASKNPDDRLNQRLPQRTA